MLSGAGSRDPEAIESVGAAARELRRAGWRAVRPAFVTGRAPRPGDVVRELRARGVRRVAVAPYVLAPGLLPDRIAAEAAAARADILSAPSATPRNWPASSPNDGWKRTLPWTRPWGEAPRVPGPGPGTMGVRHSGARRAHSPRGVAIPPPVPERVRRSAPGAVRSGRGRPGGTTGGRPPGCSGRGRCVRR
ncbi:hypothetical protein SHKM778_26160 [Streptomyces sp. KM77-8]|uniref:Sirohydrochlorin chelatase n=1 Tax=Streptomyces haneummycinicus TaxID=3074435 RepID=A0AAT9HFX2_9ACTN